MISNVGALSFTVLLFSPSDTSSPGSAEDAEPEGVLSVISCTVSTAQAISARAQTTLRMLSTTVVPFTFLRGFWGGVGWALQPP